MKNVVSRKLKSFGYSYSEPQLANPWVALRAYHYWVAKIKLGAKIKIQAGEL